MKKFGLFTKTNTNDLVHQVNAENESEALEFFSKVKNLTTNLLLEIFKVKEIK
jgi:hypothetical protein